MFEAGQIVKFIKSTPEDADSYEVVEMRGERVLVRDHLSAMSIKPTFVYLAAEMEAV